MDDYRPEKGPASRFGFALVGLSRMDVFLALLVHPFSRIPRNGCRKQQSNPKDLKILTFLQSSLTAMPWISVAHEMQTIPCFVNIGPYGSLQARTNQYPCTIVQSAVLCSWRPGCLLPRLHSRTGGEPFRVVFHRHGAANTTGGGATSYLIAGER